jgi:diadenosine tetraphosphate (Ap4A) HIT family hydrolase
MKSRCVFCSDEVKERSVQNGTSAYVLLSNPRVVPGHLLVIPNRHVQKLSELKADEVQEIFKFLSAYQEKILAKLSKATEIRQNYKPFLKDSRTHVNHLHFHIIPRDEGDEIGRVVDVHRKPFYRDMSDEEKEKMLNLFKTGK